MSTSKPLTTLDESAETSQGSDVDKLDNNTEKEIISLCYIIVNIYKNDEVVVQKS